MADSAPLHNEPRQDDPRTDTDAATPAGFQPPTKARYRPSESWALRWLGAPAD